MTTTQDTKDPPPAASATAGQADDLLRDLTDGGKGIVLYDLQDQRFNIGIAAVHRRRCIGRHIG
ncbi:MAG: hypothetical protein ABIE70_06600 [bacterium]